MAKACKYEECSFPVWGGGFCKYHQSQRTDKKPKGLTRRVKTREELDTQKEQTQKDHEFYRSIWDERLHECFNCGQALMGGPSTIYFDHILEKSKYPLLRYEPSNICLLCWDCHANKTNGVSSDKLKKLRLDTMTKLLLDGTEPAL